MYLHHVRMKSSLSSVQKHENPSGLGLRRQTAGGIQLTSSHGFSAIWKRSVFHHFEIWNNIHVSEFESAK